MIGKGKETGKTKEKGEDRKDRGNGREMVGEARCEEGGGKKRGRGEGERWRRGLARK